MADSEQIEAAAFELYAAGPWGEIAGFLDNGARLATDCHDMRIYREMVRLVVGVLEVAPGAQPSSPGPTHTEQESE